MTLALTHEKTEQARDLAFRGVELSLDTSKKLENVERNIQEITDIVYKNAKVAEDSQDRQGEQFLLQNLQHTLKATAVETTNDWYSLFKRKLLDGSGSWLEGEFLFETWLQGHAPILWVFGGPGSGKTMLSTWLITMLNKKLEAKSDVMSSTSVGYFFIKENTEDLRNPNIIFKTMAWQIQETDSRFRKHAAKTCEFNRNIIGVEETWENLFLKFYQGPHSEGRRAILVIDGLDEAELDTQRRILHLLKEYVTQVRSCLPCKVQFAIFGRLELRGELEMLNLDRVEKIIEVSSVKNYKDMENYITTRLKSLQIIKMMRRRGQGGDKEARRFARGVRQKVLDGAGGVFLWAQLLLDQMAGKDDKTIKGILSNPPPNLYDMIYLVFDRLSKDREIDIDGANKLLSWIAFARRPLLFGELDVILRSNDNSTNWFLWDHVRGKFASILRVRYPKGYNPVSEESRMIVSEIQQMAELGIEKGNREKDVPFEDDDDSFSLGDSSDSDGVTFKSSIQDKELISGKGMENKQTDTQYQMLKIPDADQYYSWHQKRTVIDFSHQRFRDFLIMEDDERTRQKATLPIRINVKDLEVQLVLDCFRNLHAGIENGTS